MIKVQKNTHGVRLREKFRKTKQKIANGCKYNIHLFVYNQLYNSVTGHLGILAINNKILMERAGGFNIADGLISKYKTC